MSDLISRQDAIDLIMETDPEWCVGMTRAILEGIKTLPSARSNKRNPLPKLEPCVCGRKRIEQWLSTNGTRFYMCPNCGKKSGSGNSNREARTNWNNYMKMEKSDE